MTLTMLECFVAAMETLNFTTASVNMHITQPAFSRNISALEDDLGFPLFIRSKQNGLSATPAAEELYRGVKQIFSEFDVLLKDARRISRGECGKLVIGIQNGVCTNSVSMTAIQLFKSRYPDVDLQVICYPLRDLIDGVVQGKIDTCLVIRGATTGKSELNYRELFEVENYLGVPAKLGCDANKIYSLKDFENEYFLLSSDAPALNGLLINACKRAGFEPKVKIAPDFETKMLWIEFGEGVSVNTNEYYLKDSPLVDFVRVREIAPESQGLTWHKSNNNPTINMLANIITEVLEK